MWSARKMKSSTTNYIEIDKAKVMQEINENGQYEDNNIYIKLTEMEEEEENQNTYITEMTKNNSLFIGVLNDKFKREGYGLNNFENGDKYFGYYEDDQRSKNGIYFWNPEIKGKNTVSECYFGNWKNNKKEKSGIYLWLTEPTNSNSFDEANFEAFVGEFEDDMYKEGFQNAINAALPYYQKAEFDETDYEAAAAIIKHYTDLYDEIQKALELLGNDNDATFTDAINNAVSSFNNANADLDAAVSTLKAAIDRGITTSTSVPGGQPAALVSTSSPALTTI